jgi:HlyD family secretion protein
MPKRQTLALVGSLALGLIGVYWLLQPRPILVDTAPVVSERFTAIVEEDGRTRVRDRYLISAPLSGRVPRSPLMEGDAIKTGQTIATITPNVSPLLEPRARQELEARLGSAQAAVEEASALKERTDVLLARARTDLERTTQLNKKGVTTVAQLERDTFVFQAAEREEVAAERRHHVAEHLLDQARAALKRSTDPGAGEDFPVSSPIDGRVLRVIQKSEAAVSIGAPLVELGDPSDLEVIVDVLTTDAALIKEGAQVVLDRWGGATALEGRVRRVEPSGFTKISALGVEEQRVWIIIDITSPRAQWTGLGDGYRVDVKIAIDTIENATVVPTGALFRRGDAWYVFVIDGARARLRQVELASRSGRLAAIAQGLRPGAAVVVYPPSTLADGSPVRLP